MFLCSVASELSNYDSHQSVHFCVLIVFILLGDVIKDNPWVVQAEMEGCNFTIFSQNFLPCLRCEIVNNSSRLVGNERNVIIVTYGKCRCGPTTTMQVNLY